MLALTQTITSMHKKMCHCNYVAVSISMKQRTPTKQSSADGIETTCNLLQTTQLVYGALTWNKMHRKFKAHTDKTKPTVWQSCTLHKATYLQKSSAKWNRKI